MKKLKFIKTFEKFAPAPSPAKPSPRPSPDPSPGPSPDTLPSPGTRPERPVKPMPPTEPERPVTPVTVPDEDEKPMATEEDVVNRLMYELDKKNMTFDEFKKGGK